MFDFSRRRVLLGLGALGLVPRMAEAGAEFARVDAVVHVRELLTQMFGDVASAQAVGRAYLRSHPHDGNPRLLIADLLGPGVPPNAASLARLLAARRSREFRDGETVVVNGWVLARSEARLCALTILL